MQTPQVKRIQRQDVGTGDINTPWLMRTESNDPSQQKRAKRSVGALTKKKAVCNRVEEGELNARKA
jgi:hypothetical protein